MSIFTASTTVSYRYFERKPKSELASIIMANIDRIEIFKSEYDSEMATLRREHAELLRALKAVVAVSDRKTFEYDLAHAVIAKAEGRS